MTKADIINIIAQGTGLTKLETQAVVDGFLATISYALRNGESVQLRGFGSFRVVERKARTARNPKTGELIQIPRRLVPVFRVSPDLKQYIYEEEEKQQEELL